MKAAVQMLFPLVFLVIRPLVIVLLYPAATGNLHALGSPLMPRLTLSRWVGEPLAPGDRRRCGRSDHHAVVEGDTPRMACRALRASAHQGDRGARGFSPSAAPLRKVPPTVLSGSSRARSQWGGGGVRDPTTRSPAATVPLGELVTVAFCACCFLPVVPGPLFRPPARGLGRRGTAARRGRASGLLGSYRRV